jgi:hypothetical protein
LFKNVFITIYEKGKEVPMRKHNAVALISALALIAVGVTILPAYGQEKAKPEEAIKESPEFTVARLVIGTGVEDREPVGAAEIFPETTEKVYCFLEATEIAQDTEVTFVWLHSEEEMLRISLPLKMGSRWRTYASKNLRGLKGDWKVEIRDVGGDLMQEATFKVE